MKDSVLKEAMEKCEKLQKQVDFETNEVAISSY